MNNLAYGKQKLGQFSENPKKLTDGFKTLIIVFYLTWDDLQVPLSTCYSPEEKVHMWVAAHNYVDEVHTWDNTKDVGTTAVPHQTPDWQYQTGDEDHGQLNHMITCLTEGIKDA